MISKILSKFSKKSLLTNTSIYMLGNFISQGLAFLLLPVFTRYLSPEDYGIYNYTNSIKTILAMVATLSLNSFVLRHFFLLTTDADRKKLIGSTFVFITIFSGLLLFIEYLSFPILIQYFNISVPFHPYFKLALINNFLEVLFIIPLAYLRIKKFAFRFIIVNSLHAFLTISAGLILVIGYNQGVLGRYYGVLIANTVFACIYFCFILKISHFKFDWSVIKKGLKFSFPLLPAAILSMGIASFDKIWLERHVSLSDLGIYTLSFTIGTLLLILVRAFYQAVEPDIFEAYNTHNFNRFVHVIKKDFLFIITVLGCLAIIFSKEVVTLMLAPKFLEAYKIIPFFILGSLFSGVCILSSTIVLAANKTEYELKATVFGFLTNVVCNVLLIPQFGIWGAALSYPLTFLVTYLVLSKFASKVCGVNLGTFADTLKLIIPCALSYIVMSINAGTYLMALGIKIFIAFAFLFWIYKFRLYNIFSHQTG